MADPTFASLDDALLAGGITDPGTPPAPPAAPAVPPAEAPAPPTVPAVPAADASKPAIVAATSPALVPSSTPAPSSSVPAADANPPAAKPDRFAGIELPPYAKPGTAASFQKLKDKAEADIVALETQLAELRSKADAPVSADKLPKEVAEELATLRTFRETHALEADPVFEQKFAAPLVAIDDAIYAKFAEIGVPPAAIEQMKGFGGPAALDLDDMYAKLEAAGKDTTGLKRFVEAKLTSREVLMDDKVKAVKEAKENYGKFAEARKTEQVKAEKAKLDEVAQHLDTMVKLSPQFAVEELPAAATPDQKKAHETHKSFITGLQTRMSELAKDMNPSNFAQAIAAWGIAHVFKAKLDAETGVTKALQAELATVKGKLDKIVAAGAAPKPGAPSTPRGKGEPKPVSQFGSTEEAFAALQDEQKANQE